MTLPSTSRMNAAVTNAAFHLRAAERVALLDTGCYEVVGTCGHRLTVVAAWEREPWERRIAEGRRHRRRCWDCPKVGTP